MPVYIQQGNDNLKPSLQDQAEGKHYSYNLYRKKHICMLILQSIFYLCMYNNICCIYTSPKKFSKGKQAHVGMERLSGGKVRSDICFAFDRDGSCPYKVCRFKHMCSKCGSRHPASQCRRSVKGWEEARGIPQNMWRLRAKVPGLVGTTLHVELCLSYYDIHLYTISSWPWGQS